MFCGCASVFTFKDMFQGVFGASFGLSFGHAVGGEAEVGTAFGQSVHVV